ncbi:MAG: formamidopyrimidine-DNA glycosylase, partial [Gemmatimonadaceae bacterium]|nr:formamidopyrimidine-DNA glycosylase [Gemmatimonadaceae bacterium]
MPELPDITIYIEALEKRVLGQPLKRVRIAKPFLLRTVEPPISAIEGKQVVALHRLGKRIAFEFEGELYLIIHLMIAGRFKWIDAGGKVPGKIGLAAFDFPNGTLVLTEAGTKRRAGLWMVQGRAQLAEYQRGGLEILDATEAEFGARLRSENHTLKRTLTDPRLFSGIGNAYSDEILHCARMSPMKLSGKISDDDVSVLFEATRSVLIEWTGRLRAETGEGFPLKVTAFRPEMAVHGKFGQPCPVCSSPVQRIRYADNETNYCARCQTEGRLLADRALSRLLKQDWPKSLDELEA